MVDTVYEIVNKRLPKNEQESEVYRISQKLLDSRIAIRGFGDIPTELPELSGGFSWEVTGRKLDRLAHPVDLAWEKTDGPGESTYHQQKHILQCLGEFVGWDMAVYEYPSFDNTHQSHISRHVVGFEFLACDIYRAWRNRKVPGPGLLCVTGGGKSIENDCNIDYGY